MFSKRPYHSHEFCIEDRFIKNTPYACSKEPLLRRAAQRRCSTEDLKAVLGHSRPLDISASESYRFAFHILSPSDRFVCSNAVLSLCCLVCPPEKNQSLCVDEYLRHRGQSAVMKEMLVCFLFALQTNAHLLYKI